MSCLVTACKGVNIIRAIAKQPPIATVEELLERCFLLGPPRGYITRFPGRFREINRSQLRDILRTGRTLAWEAEESPLLRSVTRKRLLTLRAGENLVFAAVICKVCRSAIAL
jgi:hypothetical protein